MRSWLRVDRLLAAVNFYARPMRGSSARPGESGSSMSPHQPLRGGQSTPPADGKGEGTVLGLTATLTAARTAPNGTVGPLMALIGIWPAGLKMACRQLLTARFTVRVRAPEPLLNSDWSEYRPDWNGRKGGRAHLSGSAPILTQHGHLTSDRVWTPRGVARQAAQLLSRHLEAEFGSRAVSPAL